MSVGTRCRCREGGDGLAPPTSLARHPKIINASRAASFAQRCAVLVSSRLLFTSTARIPACVCWTCSLAHTVVVRTKMGSFLSLLLKAALRSPWKLQVIGQSSAGTNKTANFAWVDRRCLRPDQAAASSPRQEYSGCPIFLQQTSCAPRAVGAPGLQWHGKAGGLSVTSTYLLLRRQTLEPAVRRIASRPSSLRQSSRGSKIWTVEKCS